MMPSMQPGNRNRSPFLKLINEYNRKVPPGQASTWTGDKEKGISGKYRCDQVKIHVYPPRNRMKSSLTINFSSLFQAINAQAGVTVREWLLCPGMEFNATVKWWGDRAGRLVPHEGLDLAFFKTTQGRVIHLDEKFRVPVIFDGNLVACFDDYLGKTMIFIHPSCREDKLVLCSIFGHVHPLIDWTGQARVMQGEPVAGIATVSTSDICSHLHLSMGWILETNIKQLVDWEAITTPGQIRLIDPANLVGVTTMVNHGFLFPAHE